jgi:hypothetical protein
VRGFNPPVMGDLFEIKKQKRKVILQNYYFTFSKKRDNRNVDGRGTYLPPTEVPRKGYFFIFSLFNMETKK